MPLKSMASRGASPRNQICNRAWSRRHRIPCSTLYHLSLAACLFLGAALYSSVGHAGASAYIAFMALFSVPPAVMRPTALTLNILVASFGSYRYAQAGYFRWRVVWPFLLGSLPFAFIGGGIHLPGEYYRPSWASCLILSRAADVLGSPHLCATRGARSADLAQCPLGIGLGLLAGLTGTGGGIFLSPIIFFSAGPTCARRRASRRCSFWATRSPGCSATSRWCGRCRAELPIYVVAVMLGAIGGNDIRHQIRHDLHPARAWGWC